VHLRLHLSLLSIPTLHAPWLFLLARFSQRSSRATRTDRSGPTVWTASPSTFSNLSELQLEQRNMERANKSTKGEFLMTRTFDAPRDLVFKSWTERERLMH
jgi:hypothetical protein